MVSIIIYVLNSIQAKRPSFTHSVYDSFLLFKMNEDKIAGERQETC